MHLLWERFHFQLAPSLYAVYITKTIFPCVVQVQCSYNFLVKSQNNTFRSQGYHVNHDHVLTYTNIHTFQTQQKNITSKSVIQESDLIGSCHSDGVRTQKNHDFYSVIANKQFHCIQRLDAHLLSEQKLFSLFLKRVQVCK